MRETKVSPVTPCPPRTCTQRSTTRHTASDTNTFASRTRRPARALVQHPGGVPDRQPAHADIDFVVGEHEADTLVPDQLRAENLPPQRIIRRDVVRAPRRAQPAHAVSQPRGRKPHLRVAEALAELAKDIAGRHTQISEAAQPHGRRRKH